MKNDKDFLYGYGNSTKSAKTKTMNTTWSSFVDHILESTCLTLYPKITRREDKEQYDLKKQSLPYISAAFDGRRSNANVIGRSIIFIDLDKFTLADFNNVLTRIEELGLTFFAHTTTGDRHRLKGGARCFRVLLPTDRPMQPNEIYEVQCKLTHKLGLWGVADKTACERSRIMICPAPGASTWSFDGDSVGVDDILSDSSWIPEAEHGVTDWTAEALENAGEKSKAIASWAFEEGLATLNNGRGWAIECPNAASHSDGADGSNGSTAILLPDSANPEVRFSCRHAGCQKLNSHQHLMLGLCGIPSAYLPDAHHISMRQLKEILPFIDDADLEQIHDRENNADGELCSVEDLEDEQPPPQFSKKNTIIDGLIHFKSTWYLAGESNIGKSFFTMGVMAAISAGIPFGGQPVEPSHCFYFDAEGGETSALRKQALQIKYQDTLDLLHIVDLQDNLIDITSTKGLNTVVKLIQKESNNGLVGLIAFDSLNQTVANRSRPFDENSAADMGEIVKSLKYIADKTGGSPGVIHHPAKSAGKKTARGSGALHGAVDYAFFLEQPAPEVSGQLNLYQEKARNGIKQSPRGFILAKCKLNLSDVETSTSLMSGKVGPDFADVIGGFPQKPFYASPRDETLYLVPVALTPFQEAAEATESKGAQSRGKMQVALLATLEQLPDRDEGYTLHELVRHDHTTGAKQLCSSGRYSDALRKLVQQCELVHGRDRAGNEIATKYRLPIKINDLENRELKATEFDLA